MLSRENIIPWGNISKGILNSLIEKKKQIKNLSMVKRKYQYPYLSTMKEIQSSGRLKLTRFDNALKYLTDVHDIQIGHMQQRLLDAIRITFFPLMFENELIRNITYLK